MYKKHKRILLKVLFLFFISCIDPVDPEFDLITGLITIEGIVSNETGNSYVKIQQSELDTVFGIYTNVPINEANIAFVNTNTSEVVILTEDADVNIYLPPKGFAARVGSTWELDIKLPDGRQYKSLPETIKEPVVITKVEAEYKPDLEYSIERNGYYPGHEITVSFSDPAEEKNYYYWNYRSFETKTLCMTCTDSFYRDGFCNDFGVYPTPNQRDPFFKTYLCEVDCWRIRYNKKIEILDDEFINGSTVSQIPIANVIMYNKKDILVEIRQLSLSRPAFKYYEILKDLVEDNSSFNAPPPAALVGNMYNVKNDEEYILGRFTAAATAKLSVFIERSNLHGSGVDGPELFSPESEFNPIPPGVPEVLYAPCIEGYYSTSLKPQGWPNK